MGSLSWAFWRRVCPTVSLLLAGRREASGGPLLQVWSRSWSQPTPRWAEERQGKPEHAAGLGCRRRHRCGTPTCRLVPQGQPHHVAAQPVGEAVDPLVVEPVARRLLQLAAGQGGSGGQSGAVGGLLPVPQRHPRCCHQPRRARGQWARSAGGWAETMRWADDGPSYTPSKRRSKTGFVGQGRPRGRKPGVIETQAARGARGDAGVKSGGKRSRVSMKETQEWGTTQFPPPGSDSRDSRPALEKTSWARTG